MINSSTSQEGFFPQGEGQHGRAGDRPDDEPRPENGSDPEHVVVEENPVGEEHEQSHDDAVSHKRLGGQQVSPAQSVEHSGKEAGEGEDGVAWDELAHKPMDKVGLVILRPQDVGNEPLPAGVGGGPCHQGQQGESCA